VEAGEGLQQRASATRDPCQAVLYREYLVEQTQMAHAFEQAAR
jgi:hypothetical protein